MPGQVVNAPYGVPYNAIGQLEVGYFDENNIGRSSRGTAFIFNKIAYLQSLETEVYLKVKSPFILTAAHLLKHRGGRTDAVNFYLNGRRIAVDVWATHPAYDWRVEGTHLHEPMTIHDIGIGRLREGVENLGEIKVAAIGKPQRLINRPLVVSGFHEEDLWRSNVTVAQWPLDQNPETRNIPFRYDVGATSPGMSGGPVFDPVHDNAILGIISGRVENNANVAAPIMCGIGNQAFEFIEEFVERFA